VLSSVHLRLTAIAVVLGLSASGCWSHVEDYCRGCAVADREHTALPATPATTHTEVVLVHGAWGFGGEWKEVVETVRQSPGFSLVAWSWPGPFGGPFHNPKQDALALRAELQALLDGLPPSVGEILVFAHSAGGLITNLAVRQLNVPSGRHMTVVLLDPALHPTLAKREEYPPLPSGVVASAFFAAVPPARPGAAAPPSGADATDLPWQYVGAVGHDPMVAKVSLPILAARREARPDAVP
jgi:alpha-beta hydrolase superfamily lysophospholipase